ncbi:hypothetical protein [Pseudonocardia pini]|uniref:hypothetical protein n=1 Tax=Pseudonocardia pini TaxID=2758030 RepID=UPI0015F01268|nr:hypothetical protein [Pseudonocardia pini]
MAPCNGSGRQFRIFSPQAGQDAPTRANITLDQYAEQPQVDQDAMLAWSLASNSLLHENDDPGPAELNVDSEDEPLWMPVSQAWQESYA